MGGWRVTGPASQACAVVDEYNESTLPRGRTLVVGDAALRTDTTHRNTREHASSTRLRTFDRLELPLRTLSEEPARVVVERLGRLGLAVPPAAVFQAGVGELAGAALAPVAGAVHAEHLRAEGLHDVRRPLRRHFADGVDRQPGPEAVVAGHPQRVLLAVVDQHALGA